MTHLRRLTTLAELGDAAAFLSSELASGMTGMVANLSGGAVPDRGRRRPGAYRACAGRPSALRSSTAVRILV